MAIERKGPEQENPKKKLLLDEIYRISPTLQANKVDRKAFEEMFDGFGGNQRAELYRGYVKRLHKEVVPHVDMDVLNKDFGVEKYWNENFSHTSNIIRHVGEAFVRAGHHGVAAVSGGLALTDSEKSGLAAKQTRKSIAAADQVDKGAVDAFPATDWFKLWEDGEYGKAIKRTPATMAEEFAKSSASSMSGLVLTPGWGGKIIGGLFSISEVGRIAAQAAKNDGRKDLKPLDFARGAAGAGVNIMPWFALGKVLPKGKATGILKGLATDPKKINTVIDVAKQASKVTGVTMLTEGATEVFEEFVTSYATKKGVDPDDILLAAKLGLFLGGGIGATSGTVAGGYHYAQNKSNPPDPNAPEAPPNSPPGQGTQSEAEEAYERAIDPNIDPSTLTPEEVRMREAFERIKATEGGTTDEKVVAEQEFIDAAVALKKATDIPPEPTGNPELTPEDLPTGEPPASPDGIPPSTPDPTQPDPTQDPNKPDTNEEAFGNITIQDIEPNFADGVDGISVISKALEKDANEPATTSRLLNAESERFNYKEVDGLDVILDFGTNGAQIPIRKAQVSIQQVGDKTQVIISGEGDTAKGYRFDVKNPPRIYTAPEGSWGWGKFFTPNEEAQVFDEYKGRVKYALEQVDNDGEVDPDSKMKFIDPLIKDKLYNQLDDETKNKLMHARSRAVRQKEAEKEGKKDGGKGKGQSTTGGTNKPNETDTPDTPDTDTPDGKKDDTEPNSKPKPKGRGKKQVEPPPPTQKTELDDWHISMDIHIQHPFELTGKNISVYHHDTDRYIPVIQNVTAYSTGLIGGGVKKDDGVVLYGNDENGEVIKFEYGKNDKVTFYLISYFQDVESSTEGKAEPKDTPEPKQSNEERWEQAYNNTDLNNQSVAVSTTTHANFELEGFDVEYRIIDADSAKTYDPANKDDSFIELQPRKVDVGDNSRILNITSFNKEGEPLFKPQQITAPSEEFSGVPIVFRNGYALTNNRINVLQFIYDNKSTRNLDAYQAELARREINIAEAKKAGINKPILVRVLKDIVSLEQARELADKTNVSSGDTQKGSENAFQDARAMQDFILERGMVSDVKKLFIDLMPKGVLNELIADTRTSEFNSAGQTRFDLARIALFLLNAKTGRDAESKIQSYIDKVIDNSGDTKLGGALTAMADEFVPLTIEMMVGRADEKFDLAPYVLKLIDSHLSTDKPSPIRTIANFNQGKLFDDGNAEWNETMQKIGRHILFSAIANNSYNFRGKANMRATIKEYVRIVRDISKNALLPADYDINKIISEILHGLKGRTKEELAFLPDKNQEDLLDALGREKQKQEEKDFKKAKEKEREDKINEHGVPNTKTTGGGGRTPGGGKDTGDTVEYVRGEQFDATDVAYLKGKSLLFKHRDTGKWNVIVDISEVNTEFKNLDDDDIPQEIIYLIGKKGVKSNDKFINTHAAVINLDTNPEIYYAEIKGQQESDGGEPDDKPKTGGTTKGKPKGKTKTDGKPKEKPFKLISSGEVVARIQDIAKRLKSNKSNIDKDDEAGNIVKKLNARYGFGRSIFPANLSDKPEVHAAAKYLFEAQNRNSSEGKEFKTLIWYMQHMLGSHFYDIVDLLLDIGSYQTDSDKKRFAYFTEKIQKIYGDKFDYSLKTIEHMVQEYSAKLGLIKGDLENSETIDDVIKIYMRAIYTQERIDELILENAAEKSFNKFGEKGLLDNQLDSNGYNINEIDFELAFEGNNKNGIDASFFLTMAGEMNKQRNAITEQVVDEFGFKENKELESTLKELRGHFNLGINGLSEIKNKVNEIINDPAKRKVTKFTNLPEREGEDWRKGENANDGMFWEKLGLKVSVYSKSIPIKEQWQVSNMAFDAFNDLAKVLNINPRAMGLRAKDMTDLVWTYAKTGFGKSAMAHYRVSQNENLKSRNINQVRQKGDGAIAHETGHAFDDWATRFMWEGEGNPDIKKQIEFIKRELQFVNEFDRDNAREIHNKRIRDLIVDHEKPKFVLDAMKSENQRMGYHLKKTEYYKESLHYDNNLKGKYFTKPEEMFARAFEAYVHDKMQEYDASNEFLVNSIAVIGATYPKGDERTYFNQLFDDLFANLRADDDGYIDLTDEYKNPDREGYLEKSLAEFVSVAKNYEFEHLKTPSGEHWFSIDEATYQRVREALLREEIGVTGGSRGNTTQTDEPEARVPPPVYIPPETQGADVNAELQALIELNHDEKIDANEIQVIRDKKHDEIPKTRTPFKDADGNETGGVVPIAIAPYQEKTINKLKGEIGDFHEYVSDKIDLTVKELKGKGVGALSAEQVMGIAIAIHKAEQGKAVINAFEAGFGKGRIGGGLLKYAMLNDMTPIFSTANDRLFMDIGRDLHDVKFFDALYKKKGIKKPRIFNTNVNTIPINMGHGIIIPPTTATKKETEMQAILDGKKEVDLILTTYSQFDTTERAENRFNFIMQQAPKAFVVADEIHKAGKIQEQRGMGGEMKRNRALRLSNINGRAKMVSFLSATPSKDADSLTMFLPRSTLGVSLGINPKKISQEAVTNAKNKIQKAVIERGEQIYNWISKMQVANGELITVEDPWDGIEINTKIVEAKPILQEALDAYVHGLQLIRVIEKRFVINEFISKKRDLQRSAREEDKRVTVQRTGFFNTLHNLVGQSQLAIKADAAADETIKKVKKGFSLNVTLENTGESMIRNISEENLVDGQKIVDGIENTLITKFNNLYKIRVNKEDARLTLDDIQEFKKAKDEFFKYLKDNKKLLANIPISPLDYFIEKLQEYGVVTGEMTGRTGKLVTQKDGSQIYKKRTKDEIDVNKVREEFNNETDNMGMKVLLFNEKAAEGISTHAAATFKNQDQRYMIAWQSNKKVTTAKQLLNRPKRRGRTSQPEYMFLSSGDPSEVKSTLMINNAMKALNANVSGDSTGANTEANELFDMLNDNGSDVAHDFLISNPNIAQLLGFIDSYQAVEGYTRIRAYGGDGRLNYKTSATMKQVLDRLPILNREGRDAVYNHLASQFKQLLEMRGEVVNTDEVVLLEAETIWKVRIGEDRDGNGEAQKYVDENDDISRNNVYLTKARVNLQNKPYSIPEILYLLYSQTGKPLSAAAANNRQKTTQLLKAVQKHGKERVQQILDTANNILDILPSGQQKNRLLTRMMEFRKFMQEYPIGKLIEFEVERDRGRELGIVLSIQAPSLHGRFKQMNADEKANEVSRYFNYSRWRMSVILNHPIKARRFTFGDALNRGRQHAMAVHVDMNPTDEKVEDVLGKLDSFFNNAKETRYIYGGNLIFASEVAPIFSKAINYTHKDGGDSVGIMLARGLIPSETRNYANLIEEMDNIDKIIDNLIVSTKNFFFGIYHKQDTDNHQRRYEFYFIDGKIKLKDSQEQFNNSLDVKDKIGDGIEQWSDIGVAKLLPISIPKKGDENTEPNIDWEREGEMREAIRRAIYQAQINPAKYSKPEINTLADNPVVGEEILQIIEHRKLMPKALQEHLRQDESIFDKTPEQQHQKKITDIIDYISVALPTDKLDVQIKSIVKHAITNQPVRGTYSKENGKPLIQVALNDEPLSAIHHETIHALKDLGLFTNKEWGALMDAARNNNWIDLFSVNKRYPELFNNGNPTEGAYEEAIADAFARWMRDPKFLGQSIKSKSFVSMLAEFFNRIRKVLMDLAEHLLGVSSGVTNAYSVFAGIRKGEVGNRAGRAEKGAKTKYMFGGKWTARLGDIKRQEDFNKAVKMDKEGVSKDKIWKETGWIKYVDDKWRWEMPNPDKELVKKNIDKALVVLERLATKKETKRSLNFYLDEIIGNKSISLYKIHKSLKINLNIKRQVILKDKKGNLKNIVYVGGETTFVNDKPLNISIHINIPNQWFTKEKGKDDDLTPIWRQSLGVGFKQSFIKHKTRLARFESNKKKTKFDVKVFSNNDNQYDVLLDRIYSSLMHEIQHIIQQSESHAIGSNGQYGVRAYIRQAGEAEARETQNRIGKSAEWLANNPPSWDGIPEKDLIVKSQNDRPNGVTNNMLDGIKYAKDDSEELANKNLGTIKKQMEQEQKESGKTGLLETTKEAINYTIAWISRSDMSLTENAENTFINRVLRQIRNAMPKNKETINQALKFIFVGRGNKNIPLTQNEANDVALFFVLRDMLFTAENITNTLYKAPFKSVEQIRETIEQHNKIFEPQQGDSEATLIRKEILRQRVDELKQLNEHVKQRLIATKLHSKEALQNEFYWRNTILEFADQFSKSPYTINSKGKLIKKKGHERKGTEKAMSLMLGNHLQHLYQQLNNASLAEFMNELRLSSENKLFAFKRKANEENKVNLSALMNDDPDVKRAINRAKQRIAIAAKYLQEAWEALQNRGRLDYENEAVAGLVSLGSDRPLVGLWELAANLAKTSSNDGITVAANYLLGALYYHKSLQRKALGDSYVDPENADMLIQKYSEDGKPLDTFQQTAKKGQKALMFFNVETLTQNQIDALRNAVKSIDLKEVEDRKWSQMILDDMEYQLNDLKKVLTVGKPYEQMILRTEIVEALNNFHDQYAENVLAGVAEIATNAWRGQILFVPWQWAKYNINNAAGDTEALVGASHFTGVFTKMKRAYKIIKAYKNGETLYGLDKEILRLGLENGSLYGLTSAEIQGVMLESEGFKDRIKEPWMDLIAINKLHKIPGRMASAWFKFAKESSVMRENIVRLAFLMDAYDSIITKDVHPITYGPGGANRQQLMNLTKEQQVVMIVNRTIGDYGDLTQAGRTLKKKIIPFVSWKFTNTARNSRNIHGVFHDALKFPQEAIANSPYLIASKKIASMTSLMLVRQSVIWGIRMFLIAGAINIWNRTQYEDEWRLMRKQPGRNYTIINGEMDENGKFSTWTVASALKDYLKILGAGDMTRIMAWEAYEGNASVMDVMQEMAKSPVNDIQQSISPLIKGVVELMAKYSSYPDIFHPRKIHSRFDYFASVWNAQPFMDYIRGAVNGKAVNDGIGKMLASWLGVHERTAGKVIRNYNYRMQRLIDGGEDKVARIKSKYRYLIIKAAMNRDNDKVDELINMLYNEKVDGKYVATNRNLVKRWLNEADKRLKLKSF